jgi:hypothetical protein
MSFARWISVFLSEKGVELDELLEVEGPSGLNVIPVECLVELMRGAPAHEQRGIKATLVKIDFVNGDVRHYLRHLACAVAK